MVYGVKCCTEIERNNDGGFARVRGEENTVWCEEWMFRWNGGSGMLTGTG